MDSGPFTDGSLEVSGSPELFCTEGEERFVIMVHKLWSWQEVRLNLPFRIAFVCPPGILAPDKRQLLR